jgi:hypothetical protein
MNLSMDQKIKVLELTLATLKDKPVCSPIDVRIRFDSLMDILRSYEEDEEDEEFARQEWVFPSDDLKIIFE